MAQRSLDAIKKDPTIVLRSQWHAQQASQIDSKYVRKVLAQQGQTTAEYKKGVAEGLPSFPGYVKDLREKQTEEANKATKQDFKADQDLAKSLGETILPAYEKTLKLIAEKMDTMLAEFEVKLKMSRNAS